MHRLSQTQFNSTEKEGEIIIAITKELVHTDFSDAHGRGAPVQAPQCRSCKVLDSV